MECNFCHIVSKQENNDEPINCIYCERNVCKMCILECVFCNSMMCSSCCRFVQKAGKSRSTCDLCFKKSELS